MLSKLKPFTLLSKQNLQKILQSIIKDLVLQHLNFLYLNKGKQSNRKWARYLNRYFFKDVTEMVNK